MSEMDLRVCRLHFSYERRLRGLIYSFKERCDEAEGFFCFLKNPSSNRLYISSEGRKVDVWLSSLFGFSQDYYISASSLFLMSVRVAICSFLEHDKNAPFDCLNISQAVV